MNRGRASKCYLCRIKVLQNHFLKASLFCKSVLYSTTFGILKLDDMIDLEHAKLFFRFNSSMLPDYFKNYFVKQETIYHYHTRQKSKKDLFLHFCLYRMGNEDNST